MLAPISCHASAEAAKTAAKATMKRLVAPARLPHSPSVLLLPLLLLLFLLLLLLLLGPAAPVAPAGDGGSTRAPLRDSSI